MTTKIFVNLAVKNLPGSIEFFKNLGFTFNPQFTDETAACMVISNDIYAMLLTEKKFQEFTKKEIADATKITEVLTALAVDSKDQVNRIVDTALEAGATEAREPMDYGFMFGRSFNDLDGHIWEIIWMDPSHVKGERD
jgi:predicted lactoylglutathione lyase